MAQPIGDQSTSKSNICALYIYIYEKHHYHSSNGFDRLCRFIEFVTQLAKPNHPYSTPSIKQNTRGRSSRSRIIIQQFGTPSQHQQHQHYQQQQQHQNHYENQHQLSHTVQNCSAHKTEVAPGVVSCAGNIPNVPKIKAQSYPFGTNDSDRGVAFSKAISCNNQTLILSSSGISQETLNQSVGSSRANSLPRPHSPSPSVSSEKHDSGDLHVSSKV